MKKIFLLGSTGSIGRNTLDVVNQHPDEFKVIVLVANSNIDLLAEQIKKYKPKCAVVYDRHAYQLFMKKYSFNDTVIAGGKEGLINAIKKNDLDLFINAFVGFAGLEPTIKAIKSGINIALANKETLVVAGALIKHLLNKYHVSLFPIDSEHSAVWQCLAGEEDNKIKRLILTASGGPFRTWNKEDLASVSPEQALKHPNWNMGAKITIDSATMMNKGLEVIEAYWLYEIPVERIEVIIHPMSIIHSMVEFEDHSIKAQLGIPDMRIPIQYALTYPERLKLEVPRMDFNKINTLTFENPDFEKFPCLKLAYDSIRQGKTYPAVLNAANEIAVQAFLNRKIKFTEIAVIIENVLNSHSPLDAETLDDYLLIDNKARMTAQELIEKNHEDYGKA
jgi:1-deoxy-D-xylulose-5-phosphate reductoisomerase